MARNDAGEICGAPDELTSALFGITWTANEPTAAATQTIADGAAPTAAETGQALQNLYTMVNKLRTDVDSIRDSVT